MLTIVVSPVERITVSIPDIHAHRILILDFGSFDIDDADIEEFNPSGFILAGGPESVTELGSPRAPQKVFDFGVPVLGICYGMQTMAEQMGGKVEGSPVHEFGYAQIKLETSSALTMDIADHLDSSDGKTLLDVWMSPNCGDAV